MSMSEMLDEQVEGLGKRWANDLIGWVNVLREFLVGVMTGG